MVGAAAEGLPPQATALEVSIAPLCNTIDWRLCSTQLAAERWQAFDLGWWRQSCCFRIWCQRAAAAQSTWEASSDFQWTNARRRLVADPRSCCWLRHFDHPPASRWGQPMGFLVDCCARRSSRRASYRPLDEPIIVGNWKLNREWHTAQQN